MSESENDEDFVPDAKAEKEYESEMARQKIEPTNEKEGFGMTEEESKGWFQSFFPRNGKNSIFQEFHVS